VIANGTSPNIHGKRESAELEGEVVRNGLTQGTTLELNPEDKTTTHNSSVRLGGKGSPSRKPRRTLARVTTFRV